MSARTFSLFGPKKRFGNVTIDRAESCESLKQLGLGLSVILHKTVVVKVNPYINGGEVVLNTGGWRSATTKKCINEALRQLNSRYRVCQVDFEWYVWNTDTHEEIPFHEGYIVPLK